MAAFAIHFKVDSEISVWATLDTFVITIIE